MRMVIPSIIREVLIITMNATEFPDVYRGHLLACSRNIPVTFTNASNYIGAIVDIGYLGDSNDLSKGYHREALADDLGTSHSGRKPRIHLPYAGQGLYNADTDKRAEFWEAIEKGIPYDVGKNSTKSSQVTIDTSGMFDATLLDRVSHWGEKAPEWLIIQWGSHRDGTGEKPQTKPQPLIEDLQELIGLTCSNIYAEAVVEAIASIPRAAGPGQYTRNGQVFDTINNSAQDITGRFTSLKGLMK